MAVSILLLHRIAIFFGCPIKYKSLILCAVMAFLVNFATLNISPFLTPMHYGLIIIFVLAASLGVTFYNARLLKKERRTASEDIRGEPAEETPAEEPTEEPVADETPAVEPAQEPVADEAPAVEPTEEPVADEAPAVEPTEEPVADEAPAVEPAQEPVADEAPAEEPTEEPVADEAPAVEPAQEPVADEAPAEEPAQEPAADEAPAEEPTQEPVADEAPAEEPAQEPVADEAPAVEPTEEPIADEAPAVEPAQEPVADEAPAVEPTEEPVADEAPAVEPTQEPVADEAPAEEPTQEPVADEAPAEEPTQEPVADEAPAEESAQELVADEAPADEEELDDEDLDIEPAMPPSEEERQRAKEELKELTEAVGRLRSMDDYLDYADQEVRAHRSRHAVFAYKQALGIYWNDDYAPFIAINLSNTYKDMGDYEAAVDTYEAALILPAAQKNAAMQQEFRRSIDYLRRVHDILASHGIADTPFAQIPPAISAEIENAGSKA